MHFSDIIGQDHIKSHLIHSASQGRVPHAQLFIGPEGCGTLPMAIAYAQYLLCKNIGTENSGGNNLCNDRCKDFSHPDLHFFYPSATTEEIKTKPKSSDFIVDWRLMLQENPYVGLFDWYNVLGGKNKQLEIRVSDAQEILRLLSLKSFEGGYKVVIIWMAEKLNSEASNKLLKILEEPENNTVVILIAEDEESVIQTIRSRCQALHFQPLPESAIADALVNRQKLIPRDALLLARQSRGNYNLAVKLITNTTEHPFEEWFIQWVRAAFRAKGNAAAINDLIKWSETIATIGREPQKRFLNYCIDMFRQALLLNYQAPSLVYYQPQIEKFKLENFASFVNDKNIIQIFEQLSDAIYHIERNGNPKIILTDLSIKLTRLIHKK